MLCMTKKLDPSVLSEEWRVDESSALGYHVDDESFSEILQTTHI